MEHASSPPVWWEMLSPIRPCSTTSQIIAMGGVRDDGVQEAPFYAYHNARRGSASSRVPEGDGWIRGAGGRQNKTILMEWREMGRSPKLGKPWDLDPLHCHEPPDHDLCVPGAPVEEYMEENELQAPVDGASYDWR